MQYLRHLESKSLGWQRRRTLISALENAPWLDTENPRKIRASLIKNAIGFKKPKNQELETAYFQIIEDLRSRYPDIAFKTAPQKEVEDFLSTIYRGKTLTNCWIGNFNVDLFIPSAGGHPPSRSYKHMRGIVIEVDGRIHEQEFKMKKDEHKEKGLKKLGISLCSIRNSDLLGSQWKTVVREIANSRRLSARTLQNLMRRIYLETIGFHEFERLNILYGAPLTQVLAKEELFTGGAK